MDKNCITSLGKCGVNFIRYGESVVRGEISDQDCRETQSRRDAELDLFLNFDVIKIYHPLPSLDLPNSLSRRQILVQNFNYFLEIGFSNNFAKERGNNFGFSHIFQKNIKKPFCRAQKT